MLYMNFVYHVPDRFSRPLGPGYEASFCYDTIYLLVECLALWASGSGPEALFEPALLLVETDTYTSCSSYICEMPVLDAIQCMKIVESRKAIKQHK